MPCRDYSDDFCIIDNTNRYKEIRDKLARIACVACTKLEELGYDISELGDEAGTWWPEHKEADRKRRKKEKEERLAEAERKRAARAAHRESEIAELKRLRNKYGSKV